MTASLPGRLRVAATIIAPATAVTSLLFFFGYVATRARLRYFGVYLDMVDLSVRETMLYGVEAIYPPLVLFAFAGLLATGLHAGARWLVASPRRDLVSGWAGAFLVVVGVLAFARGVTGFLLPTVSRGEPLAVTPLGLGLGVLGVGYGSWLLHTVGTRRDARLAAPAVLQIGRHAVVWALLIALASSFWVVNEFAAAYGRGRAEDDAARLAFRPEVVLYTREPLAELPCGVDHAPSRPPGGSEGSEPRHRYTGLRLLVEAGNRLFLVPAHWDEAESRTLVVPYDSTVRLELRPPPATPPAPC
ncbi:hypothetical protein [Streptomyces sparsus]